jgi:hypothetical protein
VIRHMIVITCAVTLLSACAVSGELPPERIAPTDSLPKKCAVVAIVNSVARLTHVGVTVFGNERLPDDVKALRYAERLEERTVVALRQRLPSVKAVDLGSNMDLRYIDIGIDEEPSSQHARRLFDQRKQVESIAASQGHDCLIAVTPAPRRFLDDLVAFGVGMRSQGQTAVSAFSGLLVMTSLPDGKVMAMRRTSNPPDAQKVFLGDQLAAIALDGVSWRDPAQPSAKVLQDKAVQDFRASLDRLSEVVAGNVVEMLPAQ